MAARPRIALVGAGNLAAALAVSLRHAGYTIAAVLTHSRGQSSRGQSLQKAKKLAREVGAQASIDPSMLESANLVWFCVPDAAITTAAQALASRLNWKGKVALHSSGALTSDELSSLRRRGAAVASVHPLMTFVRRSQPSLLGVPFAVEGDAAAVRVARRVLRDLGSHFYSIRKKDKAAYHAWGTFASPLLIALLATTENVGVLAGMKQGEARRRMIPILQQTLANYSSLDAASAFSGPIIRGDVDTVKRHFRVLHNIPAAREVYIALLRAALLYLPAKNKNQLRKLLDSQSH
jgi:predicted short-subunit dehydrogenase-like oxidoreductase (DUF2520 family)